MKRSWILLVVAVAVVAATAQAWCLRRRLPAVVCFALYSLARLLLRCRLGMPLVLVVPPVRRQTGQLELGVRQFASKTYIRARFTHGWPGPGIYDRAVFSPTPPWPSDTTQFGVYYVRGPK